MGNTKIKTCGKGEKPFASINGVKYHKEDIIDNPNASRIISKMWK